MLLLAIAGLLACSSAFVSDPPGSGADASTDSAAPVDTSGPGDSAPPQDTAVEQVGPAPDDALNPPYDPVAIFVIDTDGVEIGSAEKIPGTLTIVRDHDGSFTDLDSAPVAALWPIGIEVHGSSSTGYPKLPYRFECRDDVGAEVGCGLLDLPGASDWVLHAPYSDKTLVRNAYAYSQARAVAAASGGGAGYPTGAWQPRTAPVEVVLNGDYRGVYLLVERAQRDDDRLDLQKPAATAAEGDLSGGYIVKIDAARGVGWQTSTGTLVDYHQPRAGSITAEQTAYLQGWFTDFEAALAADSWQNQALGYPAWIATPVWVDHILLTEAANNVDGYRLSTYLYKDRSDIDPLLYVGPLWDLDRAYGNVNYCDCWNTSGWVKDELTTCGYAYQYPFWWVKLLDDPAIQDAARCRWEALRADVMSDANISARLDALVAALVRAQPRDDSRWGTIGVNVDPNYYVGATYSDEVEWLRSWALARAAWMDDNLPGACK